MFFEKQDYQTQNFQNEYKSLQQTNFESSLHKYNSYKQLINKYIYSQKIKNLDNYLNLWLEIPKLVNDPEYIFIYMHSYEIANKNIKFYKNWIQLYAQNKKYLLAFQLISYSRQFFQNQDFFNKSIQKIIKKTQKEIANKYIILQNFVSAQNDEIGIPFSDFQIIKQISIEKRISDVINGQQQIWQNGQQNNRRFSDLINTKSYNNQQCIVYIDKQYRDQVISQEELLFYEFTYYQLKYYKILPFGIQQQGFDFWDKQNYTIDQTTCQSDFQIDQRISINKENVKLSLLFNDRISVKGEIKPEEEKDILSEEEFSNVNDMELGEYFLHIYVQETTGLSLTDLADIKIQIKAFGENKFSRKIEKVAKSSMTYWGEHFFFQKEFKNREDLENSYFEISVFKSKLIQFNLLDDPKIGSTQMSILNVYAKQDHTQRNVWQILTNPEKDFSKLMGYVQFSVNLVRAGEQRSNLEKVSVEEFESKKFSKLNIPPNIKLDSVQLIIRFFKAVNIAPLDFGGKADPFAKFDLGGVQIQTEVIKNSLSPVFNKNLYLPTIYPSMMRTLKMSFMDHDLGTRDDYIGSFHFKLDDIKNDKYKYPKWTHFYGGYKGKGDQVEIMNKFPKLASRYKGSALLSIEMYKTKESQFKKSDFTQQEFDMENQLTKKSFSFQIDIYYIQNFKSSPQSHHVELNWGGKIIKSKSVNYNRGILQIFQKMTITNEFEINDKYDNEKEQLPDVILSLVTDNKNYSYYRFQVKKVDLESEIQNYYLIADNSISNLRDCQAGILSGKAICGRESEIQQNLFSNLESNTKKIRIVCSIYQAKDLIPADSNGSADPIVLLYHYGSLIKTSVFPQTLNPSWNQRIVMETYMINNKIPPLILSIWDRDILFFGNIRHEFMGSVIVPLDDGHMLQEQSEIDQPVKKNWYELNIAKNQKKGKIFCSFLVVEENNFRMTKNMIGKIYPIRIKSSLHKIIINILGLRDLQSSGVFPVRKVQMKISAGSLRKIQYMQEGGAFNEYTVNSKNGGKNPAIGSVVEFTAEIPDNINHMPSLSCRIVDKGLNRLQFSQLLGTLQIILGNFAHYSLNSLLGKLEALQTHLQDQNVIENDTEYNKNHNITQQKRKDILNKIIENICVRIDYNNQQTNEEVKQILVQAQGKMRNNLKSLLKGFVKVNNYQEVTETKMSNLTFKIKRVQEVEVKQQNNFFSLVKDQKIEEDQADTDTQQDQQNGMFDNLQQLAQNDQNEQVPMSEIKVMIESEYIKDKKNGYTVWREVKSQQFERIQNQYMELGYTQFNNLEKGQGIKKQYRLILNKPLCSPYLGEETLQVIDINRGKMIEQEKSFLTKFFNFKSQNHFRKTGKFKGFIEVLPDEILKEIEKLQLSEKTMSQLELYDPEKQGSRLFREMLKDEKVTVVIYILKAQFHDSLDFNSQNDSYFYINLGNIRIKSKSIVDDSNNPSYFEVVKFEHTFPGASDLKIEFYDEDFLKKDEMIGESKIDLERRFFDQKWRNLKHVPIETLDIIDPSNDMIMGNVKLFVDLLSNSKLYKQRKLQNISPRPPTKIVLRIVIWEADKVPSEDFEDATDMYIKVEMKGFDLQGRTDTHYRATEQYGSFNWRINFNLKIKGEFKEQFYRLDFYIYDKDFASGDDYIAQRTYDISGLVKTVLETERRGTEFGEGPDGKMNRKFYVMADVNERIKSNQQARMLISIDCLTEKENQLSPAGQGRSNPNQDPYLPQPSNRFQWSWNPVKIISQLCGPQFKKRIGLIICMAVCVLILIFIVPIVISVLVARLIG